MGSVTDDELATLHRYLTAWGNGDVMAVLGSYHERLELHWPGDHRLSGVHIGRDAAVTALADLQVATRRTLHSVRSISAGTELASVELVERWVVDGQPLEVERLLQFGVRDGQITWCSVTEHQPELVDRIIGRPIAPAGTVAPDHLV